MTAYTVRNQGKKSDKEMNSKLSSEMKEACIENMTKNLCMLRTLLHLSQAELADLIGVSRQTIVYIENRTRKLSYGCFLSLMFVFTQNKETNSLLKILGIYTEELKKIYSA